MFTYLSVIYKILKFPNEKMPMGRTVSGKKIGNLHPFLNNSA